MTDSIASAPKLPRPDIAEQLGVEPGADQGEAG